MSILVNKYVLLLDKEEFLQEYVLRRASVLQVVSNGSHLVDQANAAWIKIQELTFNETEESTH